MTQTLSKPSEIKTQYTVTWEKLPDDFKLPEDPVENIDQPLLAAALREALELAGLLIRLSIPRHSRASYNLLTKKAIPDLAIEVVFTSGGIDKLQLYKRLGIPEVWFWEDGVLSIYYLREEYEKVDRSELLAELDIALLVRYVTYFDQYDAVTEFIKALRE